MFPETEVDISTEEEEEEEENIDDDEINTYSVGPSYNDED